jgi:hypothetical protein
MTTLQQSNRSASLWEPSLLLPAQWMARGGAQQRPEARLAAAILEDAVRSVARTVIEPGARQRRELQEARDWLLDDLREWPFAFLNVCELLDVDPDAVRDSLQYHLAATGEDERRDAPPPSALAPGPAGAPVRQQRRLRRSLTALERFATLGWDEA